MANEYSIYRSAKNRMFKKLLAPAGFVKGKNLYVRKKEGQLHGVDFQIYGPTYFVNIAFHYEFLPALFVSKRDRNSAMQEKWDHSPEQFDLADFLVSTRLHGRDKLPGNSAWDLTIDGLMLEKQLERNATAILSTFDTLQERWRDSTTFLNLLPPETFRRPQAKDAGPPDSEALSQWKYPSSWGWRTASSLRLMYCLGMIAARTGQVGLANEYLNLMKLEARDGFEGDSNDFIEDLSKRLT